MGDPASVSVVIRAKNEAARIGQCLAGIRAQDYPGPVDVLVIDSGSTDGTVAIARAAGARVDEIPPAEFNYGRTLNRGVEATAGEYVVALSAHCVPVDRGWLSALTAPLDRDPRVAGAYGRQVPWPDCEPVERAELAAGFGPADAVAEGVGGYRHPTDVVFSNANACLRRDVVRAVPFRPLAWAEDRVWAHDVLAAGHRVAYAAGAAVYHSHQRSAAGYYRFGRENGRVARRQLGLPLYTLLGLRCFRPWWLAAEFARWYRRTGRRGPWRAGGCVGKVVAFDLGCWRGGTGR